MTTTSSEPRTVGTTVLGRYRIVRDLAEGGMGAVYLARNEGAAGFVKPVVIKRSLRTGGKVFNELFAREARILSSLRHPNIVSIVDFAEEDGKYVMVLDYVHGYTLAQWSRYMRKSGRTMPLDLALQAVLPIVDALHHAHVLRDSAGKPLGIVHRDVKPSNVLIDVQGVVKLADFGVARTNNEVTDTTTGDATLKGTFAYMAPELFSRGTPSPATDVYSAAVTLYQLLAGRNPFATDNAVMTAARALRHEPTPLDLLRTEIPAEFAAVIARGMSKDPEQRYQSAAAFADAMREVHEPGEDVDAWFRATIHSDFTDPTIAQINDTATLDVLERAWMKFEESPAGPRRLALPLSPSEFENTELRLAIEDGSLGAPPTAGGSVHTADTVILGRPRVLPEPIEPPPVTSRRRGTISLVLAVVALGAGAAALLASRGGDAKQPEQTVVVVRGDVTMEGQPPAERPSNTAPDPTPGHPATTTPVTAPASPPTATGPAPRPAASTAQDLTAQFRRREPRVRACFDRFPDAARAAGALALRFHVDQTGAVTAAELVPEGAAAAPLQGCLTEVARTTRFSRLAEPLVFRIPISVRPR
ncbi:MAG TPA: protein kinase [Kofleriaceae bacterium]|nr:protein kinase [Kofleriaceae bacterium]